MYISKNQRCDTFIHETGKNTFFVSKSYHIDGCKPVKQIEVEQNYYLDLK